jgi:hypothetical protein
MRKWLLFTLFAVAIGMAGAPGGTTRAANSPEVCLKTCIETYGADKKQACALQCGFGSGQTGTGQGRDCGTVYKQCIQSCGSDTNCKNSCRKQRTQCF